MTYFLTLNLVTPSSRPQRLASLAELKDPMDHLPKVSPLPLGTLHLSLGVTGLLTKKEIEQAANHLRSLDVLGMLNAPPSSPSSPDSPSQQLPQCETLAANVNVQRRPHLDPVTSLVPMEPSSTSALRPTRPGHLLPETRPLELQGTVINTSSSSSSRRGRGRGQGKGTGKRARGGGGGGRRHKFDATRLVERFRDKAICRRGAREVRDEETDRSSPLHDLHWDVVAQIHCLQEYPPERYARRDDLAAHARVCSDAIVSAVKRERAEWDGSGQSPGSPSDFDREWKEICEMIVPAKLKQSSFRHLFSSSPATLPSRSLWMYTTLFLLPGGVLRPTATMALTIPPDWHIFIPACAGTYNGSESTLRSAARAATTSRLMPGCAVTPSSRL
ncbi:hypothetical protein JCM5296_004750 [Sporobolomyces johnsonii]